MSDDKLLGGQYPPDYQNQQPVSVDHVPPSYLNSSPEQPQPQQPSSPQQSPQAFSDLPQPVSLVSTNPGDTTRYPQSATLYNAMCTEFGSHNISPPPDFLQTDKARKQWLKSNQNALLYFMHRKPHYIAKVQKMASTPLCCAICSYEKASQYDQYSPCSICFVETCSYCCCTFPTVAGLRSALYEGGIMSAHGSCCPVCSGGIGFRQMFIKRLKRSGVNIHEGSCWSCLMMCFCQPCLAIHTGNIVSYLYQKRYGSGRPLTQIISEAAEESPQFRQYLDECKVNTHHPYSRSQSVVHRRGLASSETVNARERTLQLGQPTNDLMLEFYKPAKVIKQHNRYWEGIHSISMDMDARK